MERLLALKLDAVACEAEAWLNGVPVARVDAARPRAVVPVHEYTLAGPNRLELVVHPRPAAMPAPAPVPASGAAAAPRRFVADGRAAAHLHVLLPRAGHAIDEASARGLARLSWAPEAGQAGEAPVSLVEDVALPVNFARWRWADAPPVEATPVLQRQAVALLQGLALALSEGDAESFVGAARLRTEELAAAYGHGADAATRRLREHLRALHADSSLAFAPLEADGLWLRRLAGGRLLECLAPDGGPALRTAPDAAGRIHSFPMRLAAVEGRLYVLR